MTPLIYSYGASYRNPRPPSTERERYAVLLESAFVPGPDAEEASDPEGLSSAPRPGSWLEELPGITGLPLRDVN